MSLIKAKDRIEIQQRALGLKEFLIFFMESETGVFSWLEESSLSGLQQRFSCYSLSES